MDLELEQAIDKAMRPHAAGAVVAVDVRTGRLLALYSKPSFDPNDLSGGEGHGRAREAFNRLYADPLRPMLDKTMSGAFQPGSTMKPFSALAALEDHLIDPEHTEKCEGYVTFGHRIFRCSHVHGPVNLQEAIARSCNVYFFHLAETVGMDRIARIAQAFGLGQKTGLGTNPEAPGRIPTRSWYALRYRGQFRVGFTLNMAIGEGDVTVTPLQLALAYAALGNGGTLYQPQIVRAVETSDGAVVQEFPPRIRRQIPLAAREPAPGDRRRSTTWSTTSLGTAYPARDPSLDVSGKTGTAQTGYSAKKDDEPKMAWFLSQNHAWFASFAPARAPEIAVAVLVEHGGSGPEIAVPVAMQIVHEYERLQAIRLGHAPSAKSPPPKPQQGATRGAREAPQHRRIARSTCATTSTGRSSSRSRRSPSSGSSTCTRRRASRAARTPTTTSSRSTGSSAAASWPRSSRRSTTATTSGSGTSLYGVGVVLLMLVFILGREIRGSSRWIYIGSYSFQPSEFMKLFLIVALGKYLHDHPKSEGRTLKDLVGPAAIAVVPTALVLLQPDLGTALILVLVFVSICRAHPHPDAQPRRSGARRARSSRPSSGATGCAATRTSASTPGSTPTRTSSATTGTRIRRASRSATAGWFGQGFMKGSQNQFLFLHEQHSDFPFPVFAEEWGFAGSLTLLTLYGLLVLWCLRVASSAKDRFGAVIAAGVGSIVFWHAVFNLGMVTGLLPVVGVTLPLFSYGGSSVMTVLHRRGPRDERIDASLRFADPSRRRCSASERRGCLLGAGLRRPGAPSCGTWRTRSDRACTSPRSARGTASSCRR